MKNIFILFNISMMIFSSAIIKSAEKNNEIKKSDMLQNCIKKLEIPGSSNPWKGMTASYKQEEENRHIKAAGVNSEKIILIENLKKYDSGNKPFLFRMKTSKKVVINKEYFSDLEKADATAIKNGEEKIIGKFLDKEFKSTSPENLVLFLIESQIITTYWHLKSELCLVEEKNENMTYRAYFTGYHKYCTNECRSDPVKFQVIINKKNGLMSLSSWQ